MAKLGTSNSNSRPAPTEHTPVGDNLTQKLNQMRVQDGTTRGRGRGRGGPRGPSAARHDSSTATKGVEVPKEDYDFQSANAKFNKQDLVKEAIATGSPVISPSNGDVADPLSNGHAANDDVVIPAQAGAEKGYDKKSSFFDNISSDLRDRMERQDGTVDGRAMRSEERSRNMETFGQGSVDGGYRGGFRGRGRGRGFGRGSQRGYGDRSGAGYRGGAARGRGRGGAESFAV
jgi:protein LSM14